MPVIHIPPRASNEHIHAMNEHIDNGKPAFVLLYMEGCGPCGMTRPEWLKLNDKYSKNDNIGIVDIEMSEIDKITHPKLKADVMGFPTMRYVKNDVCEDYENCKGLKTDRSYKSFLEWIDKKEKNVSGKMMGGGKRKTRRYKRHTRKTKKRRRRMAGSHSMIGRMTKPIKRTLGYYSKEPQPDYSKDTEINYDDIRKRNIQPPKPIISKGGRKTRRIKRK